MASSSSTTAMTGGLGERMVLTAMAHLSQMPDFAKSAAPCNHAKV